MNCKSLCLWTAITTVSFPAFAQRQYTDRLDRGLVAVQTTDGVFCSWRIQADEYYGTKYNLYRDGDKVNDVPLSVSNFTDASGNASSYYTVRAIVGGIEQDASASANVWTKNYLEIVPRHDASLTSTYVPNDACCADVDGDGQLEILIKYDNLEESNALYPKEGNNGEYSLLECLEMDGTVLWWVNCGPNMGDFQNNEQNIVGYDWDGDGKAEAVIRLCEGAQIHQSDGTVYTVGGDNWKNYRIPKTPGGVEWFTYYGNEYLLYLEGQTGKPYQCIDYPCARFEAGETDLKTAWGDGYGHRSNKHFFGAPYLDGIKPSIFIGRGIYTRHKFVALDVNPATHELTERWRWMNNTPGPWYGQGYHNYSIADVDWDGRDEIVWGSMVIDDNGKGLSTTGLGHGDAHHVGDLNPYEHGQEGFFCNEDQPANNYRDLTTSSIYYRMVDTSDAGRAMAGNFTNDYPGSIGYGAHDTPISTVTNDHVQGMQTNGLSQNYRIYWDGDLLEECADGTSISKYCKGQLARLEGAFSNNGTKNTPCTQGDLFGDWREEVMMRTAQNNIRIYTTTIPTDYRIYSLWYDHQYRNAMVTQMCGYNQPPHASYFLGELEGITMAPPALTVQGRTIITDGETIGTAYNGQHLLVNNMDADLLNVNVEGGVNPSVVTLYAAMHVTGSAPSEAALKDYAITSTDCCIHVDGGAFGGNTRVVKQGDGTIYLPSVDQTYTGPTDVWAGSLCFSGKLLNSRLWLNRFARLVSDGGSFGTIQADYAAEIHSVNTDNNSLKADSILLGFGSRLVFKIAEGRTSAIDANVLSIEKKDWQNGPRYSAPVFHVEAADQLQPGIYPLVTVREIVGNVADLMVEGLEGVKYALSYSDNCISLRIDESRATEEISWMGAESNVWDLDNSPNFTSSTGTFVSGDVVLFTDDAVNTDVVLAEDLSPASVIFENESRNYTLSGTGALTGNMNLVKQGNGLLKIHNTNTYIGGTQILSGVVEPSALANKDGQRYGSLGLLESNIVLNYGGTLRLTSNQTNSQSILLGEAGGTIDVANGTFIQNGAIKRNSGVTRTKLTKLGRGTLQLDATMQADTVYLNEGTLYDFADNHFGNHTIVFGNATLQYNNSVNSYSSDNANYVVPEGCTGVIYPDGRCDYSGKLTGNGTFEVHATFVRSYFKGDWSQFGGTITAYTYKSSNYDPSFDFLNTYGIGHATLNITDNVTVHTNGKNFAIGALTGTGCVDNMGSNATGANTLSIGDKNIDFTFNGTIVGSSVKKVGTGTWTITKESVLESADQVSINGGAIKLNSTTALRSMTGPKTLQVNDGGAILGRGLVQNLTIFAGGEYRPGIASSVTGNAGTIKALGKITAFAGSDIYLNKSAKADYNSKTGQPLFAYVEADAEIVMDGNVHFSYKSGNSGWIPEAGDSVILFMAPLLSGNPTLDLQSLPDGLKWDTSTLMSDGCIRVALALGIQAITHDAEFSLCEVYDISGKLVCAVETSDMQELQVILRERQTASSIYLVRLKRNDGSVVGVKRVVLK